MSRGWWPLSLLWLAGCARQPLPELPQPVTQGLLPSIAEQIESANREARASPQDPDANGRFGMVLHAYQKYEQALVCYQRARLLEPRTFRWLYYQAVAEAEVGHRTEALSTLREALRLEATSPPARLRLAGLLFDSGDLDQSGRIFGELVRQDPRSAEAHLGLGRVLAARNDPGAAVEHLRQAVALAPDYGAAHYALALALRTLGEKDAADRHFALHQLHRQTRPPMDDPLLQEIADLDRGPTLPARRAMALAAAGRLQEAVQEFERALELDPQYASAHASLIALYWKLGDFPQAEQHYRRAVELSPGSPEPHLNYALLLAQQNRPQEAAKAFQKCLDINPTHAEAHTQYGFLLEKQARLKEAERHYRQALESAPNHRQAHFLLGRCLLNRGQTTAAIEHLRQTLTPEDERTPWFLRALSGAYAQGGDRELARHYAREAQRRAAARGLQDLSRLLQNDLRALERP